MAMLVQCQLCPKACLIAPGQSGECRVRVNFDGTLTSVVYGYPCSVSIDPIEKKPLFHFLVGSGILSIATVGCNLHCRNCQNWEISQANPEDTQAYPLPPDQLIRVTRQNECPSIAYTYTEPIIYYEYTLDTAKQAHQAGLRNVLVTAGYINPEPWQELLQFVDAANIDLKSINDAFYRDICQATLKPVQQALVLAKTMGVWVEVTNLIIPTLNDSDDELQQLSRWIRQNLGPVALTEGLKYVYIGNVITPDGGTTFCPECHAELIVRIGYNIEKNRLIDGRCPDCRTPLDGVWK